MSELKLNKEQETKVLCHEFGVCVCVCVCVCVVHVRAV